MKLQSKILRFRFWSWLKWIRVSLVDTFPLGTQVIDLPVVENVKILIELKLGFIVLRLGVK